jgi:hypothetical protein
LAAQVRMQNVLWTKNIPMPICFAFSCAASAATFAASRDSMGTCLVAMMIDWRTERRTINAMVVCNLQQSST